MSLPRALSKLGLCSRSQAFAIIESGRVAVNGRVARDTTCRVALEVDRIEVDGHVAVPPALPVVLALHKPVGYVTTRSDPQGRKTVYDLLPELDRFVFPVGRLDIETSGLLIMTDDHRLGEALTNPESHVPKTYEVVVDREADAAALESLRKGLEIGRGERTRPARVEVQTSGGESVRLMIVIEEGRNRQVRRMMSAVGLSVVSLTRVAIGSLELRGLPSGGIRRLGAEEVRALSGSGVLIG